MRRLVPLLFILLVAMGGLTATFLTHSRPELGLDLQGGVSVALEPTHQVDADQLDVALDVIRNRVDALGVAEPEIVHQGNAIVVQLPGAENRERVLDLIGQTAELRFRPVLSTQPADGSATKGDTASLRPRVDDKADGTVTLEDKDGELVYTLGPALATGRVVESARADLDQVGRWRVPLTMRGGEDGIDRFNRAAAQCSPPDPSVCPSGSLAIVLDSVVQSAPTIQSSSYRRDQIVITGQFNESEAKDLALVLRYGSLPVELERQNVQTVSASLGEDSLHAGITAGIAGLVVVATYMILYYRALGLVVIMGLSVWGALLFTIISWLGTTQGLALTLAGVTGIIVSVGVTSDSYIVFFERLKDEAKTGRPLPTSTERAFGRAFRTILAADITAFIGAAVLWWLTVGSVRGFAFYLGLSTILDVAVAWFFTRPMVTLLSRNRLATDARVVGIARGLALPRRPAPVAGSGGS